MDGKSFSDAMGTVMIALLVIGILAGVALAFIGGCVVSCISNHMTIH